jgi:hypothetical protein
MKSFSFLEASALTSINLNDDDDDDKRSVR